MNPLLTAERDARLSEIGDEVVRFYVEEGLTLRQVGDRFGLSRVTIGDYLNRLDVVRRRTGPPTQPLKHGTVTGYTKHGCKCPECTRANTEWCRDKRARRKARDATKERTTS